MSNIDNLKPNSDDVTIRILNADEFSREDLVDIFVNNKSLVPNSFNAHIQIAEKDGKIVGLAVLQPQYHAEPIWISEEYRNTSLHKKLIEAILEPFKNIRGLRIWIFSPNSKIAKLAMRFGFKHKDYEVFVKEF